MLTSKSESKSAVRLIEPSDCGLHGGQGEKGGACVDDKPSWPCLAGVCLLCFIVVLCCVLFLSDFFFLVLFELTIADGQQQRSSSASN